ncbi:hypothetical protein Kpol_507p14 [Vanderwaltozyma polyspora DSM 70294]|uniref:Uncharacterized protein n=1 Tax=Vanderwaltozyma polyspora (strain ATCC 22028 / DSM 70294 / BCRC 21397 / CBS 2163 / NBRC 10782 / NRRL Y-8283 / UCD 57-17) TaxID=436907 RepID=A7TPG6_VANPO|nr:uncharacterized protein Kpol_507p14 [Vanderwaltozyma polyspora DSM 70294]EDO15852.1 hypothetical protein Kpol_507p14 [Vanderwaltozyma polyspora DSM 70294]
MSFWPFAQNNAESKINKILDSYFNLLHKLERTNPIIAKFIHQEFDENDNIGNNTSFNVSNENILSSNSSSSSSVSTIPSSKNIQNKNKINSSNRLQEIQILQKFDTSGNDLPASLRSLSSNSISSTSVSSSSRTDITEDDITNATVPLVDDISSLNVSFIEGLLNESDLVNELPKQDTNLLDFICLGFFIDEKTNEKIQNVEYLIDNLLLAIKNLPIATDFSNDTFDTNKISSGNYIEENTRPPINKTETEDLNDPVPDYLPNPTEEPSFASIISFENTQEDYYLKRTRVISEILSMDAWLLVDTLMENERYMHKLWSIINSDNFISDYSAVVPVFLKIHQNLLTIKTEQYIAYISKKENLVDEILNHINISMLMEFFLKCISTDKVESSTGIINLLKKQNLITKCLDILEDDKLSTDIHASSGDFLKALISVSANTPIHDMTIGPNVLSRELASAEVVSRMIDIIVNKRSSALNITISIVIELIRKNNSDYDKINLLTATLKEHPPSDRDPIYLGYMLREFAIGLPKIFGIILDIENDSRIPFLESQLGKTFKPLGFERFKIAELFAELLHCSNMGLMNSKSAEKIISIRNKIREQLAKGDDSLLKEYEDNSEIFEDNVDESFEIPYINDDQNKKLREDPTIGDLFKIQLHDTKIIPKVMKLFLDYPWNNFWHNVVFDIIQQIFNGRMDFSYNSFLVYSMFNLKDSCKYIPNNDSSDDTNDYFEIIKDFVLKGYHESFRFYEEKNTNLGYMGHVVLIAEEVVKFSKLYKTDFISPDIFQKLQSSDWLTYCDGVLNETRVMYSKILGGGSFVEDANGNIVPQLQYSNDDSNNDTISGDFIENDDSSFKLTSSNPRDGLELVNVEDLDEQLMLSTESDLHNKLKQMLISASQDEVNARNAKNGVIILGPPE